MLRSVQTTVWSLSKKFKQLDPLQKLLFIYLITNERTSLAGVYEIDLDEIALRTGIDYRTLPDMFEAMEKIGLALYRDGWVVIPNYKANYNNRNVRAGIQKDINALPDDIKSIYESLSKTTEDFESSRATRTKTRTKTRTNKIPHPTLGVPIGETLYSNLVTAKGKKVVDDYIERISNWVVMKGKAPYKDYAAAAANWMKRDNVPDLPQEYEPPEWMNES